MKTKKSSLETYHKKRDFSATTEPKGKKGKKAAKEPIFVIQKHAASSLHYDFRIEVNGVLPSWAVPKGVPTRLGVRRLAVQTEDHPLEYAQFAGIIPAGNYGAGKVEIFDAGTYINLKIYHGKKVPMERCIEEGYIEVFLQGKKVKGGYALFRTDDYAGRQSKWLMVKMRKDKVKERLAELAALEK